MDNSSLLSKHLELIYGSVTYEGGWENALSTISTDLNLRSGLMHVEYFDKPQLDLLSFNGFTESEIALFPQYIGIDPWSHELKNQQQGRFYDADHIVDRKVLYRSQIYQEVFKEIDIEYGCGLSLGTQDYRLQLAFHASKDQGGFNTKLHYLNSLAPHILKSIHLNKDFSTLRAKTNSLSQLLDLSDKALFLVNESLHVIYSNAKADMLLQDQTDIRIKSSKLTFPRKVQAKIDHSIINHIHAAQGVGLKHPDSQFVLYDALDEPCLKVDISTISGGDQLLGYQYQSAMAVIKVEKVFKTLVIDPALLRHFYGLTPKEIQLIEYLIQGMGLKEIATALNRGLHTQKDHLKSIFLKTNTHSQQALITKIVKLSQLY